MNKLKNPAVKPKIPKNANTVSPAYETVSFSFRYLTSNKNFNFEKMDKRQKMEWQSALTERMIEISKSSWSYWHSLPKEQGTETIPVEKINFSPNSYFFSADEKVIVFRFKSQKGRIIGIKNKDSSIFYIIGLDCDYSAYDHGN